MQHGENKMRFLPMPQAAIGVLITAEGTFTMWVPMALLVGVVLGRLKLAPSPLSLFGVLALQPSSEQHHNEKLIPLVTIR